MSVETQESIKKWAVETFGEIKSNDVILKRFMDEVEELHSVLSFVSMKEVLGDELADCLIIMYQIASQFGIDLLHEVDKKMHINRNRKWNIKGDGTGQHVTE